MRSDMRSSSLWWNQSVVEAKIIEAEELRGRLKDIALAFECTFCFEKLGAGSVSFGCGHTYCSKPTCGSRSVDTCPECRLPVTTRVQLFGTLPDVGGLLEQEPAAPDVEQVQRLVAENAKASLEEIRKRSAADKSVWQREREVMQRQASRLKEGVMAAENAKAENAQALLEEMRKGREEDKAAWVREREEMYTQMSNICSWQQNTPRCRWRRCAREGRKIRQCGSVRGKRCSSK